MGYSEIDVGPPYLFEFPVSKRASLQPPSLPLHRGRGLHHAWPPRWIPCLSWVTTKRTINPSLNPWSFAMYIIENSNCTQI